MELRLKKKSFLCFPSNRNNAAKVISRGQWYQKYLKCVAAKSEIVALRENFIDRPVCQQNFPGELRYRSYSNVLLPKVIWFLKFETTTIFLLSPSVLLGQNDTLLHPFCRSNHVRFH
jgi:hypothetical protein